MKIDKRFFLSALLSVGLAFGMTACGGDDSDDSGNDQENQNGENNGDGTESLCGNGVIDEDEVCDIGLDKIQHNDDDVIAKDATCQMYGESSATDKGKEWVDGAPRCAKDCKSLSKGTCVSKDEQSAQEAEGVNGILKCSSTLAVTKESATAKVSYTMGSMTPDSGVQAAILCSPTTASIDAAINGTVNYVDGANGEANATLDVSGLKPGEYLCYVVVRASNKGAVVCPLDDGTPAKASGGIDVLEESSTVSLTIDAPEGVMATWNDFSMQNMSTTIVSEAGMLSQAGADTAASLRFVIVSGVADNYEMKISQNAAGSGNTALRLGTKGGSAIEAFSHVKNLKSDENSHLLISSANMGGKSIKIVAKTGKYGGKFSVVAGTDEIIKEFASAESFAEATGTIPAGTDKLYIYPWFEACSETTCGNLVIDSIVIE